MAHENHESNELKNTNYELFIAALSVLSIFNLFLIVWVEQTSGDPVIAQIALIMDIPLTLIFLADFAYRMKTAHSRSRYFFRQFGWADLLASVPFPNFKILRTFRIFRAGRMMREHGAKRLISTFLADRAGSALLTIIFLLFIVIEFGSLFVYWAEHKDANANIKTASDAVWWAYITITTIGYGDYYPVTNEGRFWALLVAAAGVGLFGVLTGYLANAFLAPKSDEAPSEPVPSIDSQSNQLSEVVRLLTEQRQVQTETLERLAALERMLTEARPEVTTEMVEQQGVVEQVTPRA